MPVSKTSFAERRSRIEAREAIQSHAMMGKRKRRRSLRERMLTLPCLVGLGILTGGPAYAWVATSNELHWIRQLLG